MASCLLGRREAVREEGGEFHHQICGVLKNHCLQCSMEEGNGIFLMILSYFDVDSMHNLALG